MEQNTTIGKHISVIIPVYNEAENISAIIRRLRVISYAAPVEIIISDGGPGHKTLSAIEDKGVIAVKSAPGRGPQMNAGAAVAQGDILLFLHADTQLPNDGLLAVRDAINRGAKAGGFRLSIDSPKASLKMVAWFANLRTRFEQVPYGDQAQFVRTDIFHKLGGFADIPIMEDVELFRRIRDGGLPMLILPGTVKTSPRRWDNEGVLRRTLTNWWLRIRYRLGASPSDLARHYRPHDHESDS